MFAKYGHAAYCRQTLIGGNYGLLEKVGSQDFGSKISERSNLSLSSYIYKNLFWTKPLFLQSHPSNLECAEYLQVVQLDYIP